MNDRTLMGYSKFRKAYLISLIRSHDASTRTSMEEEAQEKLDNPTITEEGAQIDPEEQDEKDKLYPAIMTQKVI